MTGVLLSTGPWTYLMRILAIDRAENRNLGPRCMWHHQPGEGSEAALPSLPSPWMWCLRGSHPSHPIHRNPYYANLSPSSTYLAEQACWNGHCWTTYTGNQTTHTQELGVDSNQQCLSDVRHAIDHGESPGQVLGQVSWEARQPCHAVFRTSMLGGAAQSICR